MTSSRRHLSMLRSYTAADVLTIGNASCGTMCIFLCLDDIAADNRRLLWIAFLLLPLALVCDVLDVGCRSRDTVFGNLQRIFRGFVSACSAVSAVQAFLQTSRDVDQTSRRS